MARMIGRRVRSPGIRNVKACRRKDSKVGRAKVAMRRSPTSMVKRIDMKMKKKRVGIWYIMESGTK